VEPALDTEVLARVATTVAPSTRSLVQLERCLGSGGCLLTGQAGGRRLFELARTLVAAGATRVQIPVCAACGQQRWLRYSSPAGLVCARCRPPAVVRRCPAQVHGQVHGQPGTVGSCPACRRARADQGIVQAVTGTLGPVDPRLVLELVGRVAARAREREQLAAWLAEHPDALTCGASAGPLALVRLLWELDAAGVVGVARARCAGCGTARRQLPLTVPGGRVCNQCLRRDRLEPCARCGQTATVAFRDAQRRAVCPRCRRRDPATFQPCRQCGRRGPVASRDQHGQPLGACCYAAPVRVCGGCGERRPITATTSSGPRCQACYQRPPRRCGVCGQLELIIRKGRDGSPDICRRCYRLPLARCLVCDRLRPCVLVAAGAPYCATHAPRPATPCAGCGRLGPVAGNLPDGPRCERCWDRARSRRGRCERCGALRRLFGPDPGRCGDCIGFAWALRCQRCGIEDRRYAGGRCARCVLAERLDALLLEPAGDVAAPMLAVRELLGAVERPRSMLRWLQTSPGAALLGEMAAGRLDLSHQALDALPAARWVAHVRAILVTAGVLPARQELLAGLAAWLDGLLATIPVAQDRWLVATFARTRLLAHLARRQGRPRRGLVGSVDAAQASVRVAAAWLGWLRDQRGHTLATCTQDDLDVWLCGPTTAFAARRFLRWAQHAGHCPPLVFPTRARLDPTQAADAQRRASIAHTLLHQPAIPTADRVAGLLVTVYGQHLSRLVALRTSDLDRRSDRGGIVCLSRGTHWLELPDPLGTWAWSLRNTPAPTSVQPGTDPAGGWLFPGGIPGRPLRPASLGNRLRRYGITARAGRNDALTEIAAAVAPVTLAYLLDMRLGTANAWAEASSGSWSRYLDDLLDDHDDDPASPPTGASR
jgi:hypothetical protein